MKNTLLVTFALLITVNTFPQADSAKYFLQKGIEEKREGRYAVADFYLARALVFEPRNLAALIEIGKSNLLMRKIFDAQQAFEKAYKIDSGNQEVIRELADLYFNNRQYTNALEFAEKCSSCNNIDRVKGMIYYNTEDYGKAQIHLEKVVKVDPTDAEASYTLARTYLELEEEQKAIPHYIRAINFDSTRINWIYELGLLYYNEGNYKNAIQYFEKAAASGYTKGNDFIENLGFAQLYSMKTELGLTTLQTIMERKPNNKELLGNIAGALYATRQFDKALEYYQKLLTLNPNDAPALYMAGMVFQQKGEKEKGQKICDKAIGMDPSLAKNRQKRDLPMGL